MPPTTTDWCTLEHACMVGGVGGQHVCVVTSGLWTVDSRVESSQLIEVTLNSLFWEHFPDSHTLTLQEYVSDHTPCAALLLT